MSASANPAKQEWEKFCQAIDGRFDDLDPDFAIQNCSVIIALGPDFVAPYAVRGRAYFLKDDDGKAMADFNRAIRLDPEDRNSAWRRYIRYRRAAYLRYASRNMSRAPCEELIAYWSQAIQLDPAFDAMGTASALTGRLVGVDGRWTYSPPDSAYDRLASAYAIRASEYVGKAEYDKAIVDGFNTVRIRLLRKEVDRREQKQDECVGRGLGCLRKGDSNKAIEYFDEAIRCAGIGAAFYYRAVAYLREGRDGAAKEDFDTATRIGYLPTRDYLYAADDDDEEEEDVDEEEDDFDEAEDGDVDEDDEDEEEEDVDEEEDQFGEAVWLDPEHAEAGFYRWLAGVCGGQYDEAIADIDGGIRLKPEGAAGRVCRGIVQICKGDFNAAIVDLDEAVRHEPRDATAHFCRGIAHGGKGQYDAAIADLDAAIRLNAQDAAAFMASSKSAFVPPHYLNGEAIGVLNRAIELDRQNGTAHYCRAIARLGKARAEADADFEEAKRRGYPATWWKPASAGPAKEPDSDRIKDGLYCARPEMIQSLPSEEIVSFATVRTIDMENLFDAMAAGLVNPEEAKAILRQAATAAVATSATNPAASSAAAGTDDLPF